MEKERIELAEIIYKESFRYQDNPPFTLASGATSPYYFDCKMSVLLPRGLDLLGKVMFNMIKNIDADAIGGLTLGADPIALATSLEAFHNGRELLPLIVRKEPKGHGTARYIEGHAAKVNKVIVVDDVITTGGSTIKAIERMREAGMDVVAAAVIIDREESNGRQNIEKLGIPVSAIFSRSEFDKMRLER